MQHDTTGNETRIEVLQISSVQRSKLEHESWRLVTHRWSMIELQMCRPVRLVPDKHAQTNYEVSTVPIVGSYSVRDNRKTPRRSNVTCPTASLTGSCRIWMIPLVWREARIANSRFEILSRRILDAMHKATFRRVNDEDMRSSPSTQFSSPI